MSRDSITNIALICYTFIGKQIIGQINIRVYPVVIVNRIKQSTVKEWDLAIKLIVVIVVCSPIVSKSLIEKWLENVVEKIFITSSIK